MPSNHLILCRPLLLSPSIFASIRVFSNESVLHIRWPKYWSFSFSISPSSEFSGLISFRMDWFDLLAVQETLKSLSEKWVAELWSLVNFTEWRDCWNFLVGLLRSILCCYSVQNTLLSASWLHPLIAQQQVTSWGAHPWPLWNDLSMPGASPGLNSCLHTY